ncbi:MAG: hypothetical protein GEU80_10355 [Dehalococcoidia bacterium]|nr:hypothetical protein [Dehalococcoidia bacterium]
MQPPSPRLFPHPSSGDDERTTRDAPPRLLHSGPSVIHAGDLSIDRDRYQVTVRGGAVRLTYLEFNVLWLIAELDGRVATYEALADALWGERTSRTRRRLAVVVSRMRSKLGEPGAACVDTVTRVGYRLAAG